MVALEVTQPLRRLNKGCFFGVCHAPRVSRIATGNNTSSAFGKSQKPRKERPLPHGDSLANSSPHETSIVNHTPLYFWRAASAASSTCCLRAFRAVRTAPATSFSFPWAD